ncbi:tyrosine-type recombinase/integrase [Vibrio alginolyticus]|uniref:tyrosine-type recombinase/integrase n=1 Tax=Vibrio alginolyticus TaxID=663 RepID=UPI00215C7DE1|nr:site-specific integrase [Vibrio alginolyticus]MCR9328418.1 tyrosine-type recombinase/integrase [Vibrio alginolyticus]MCR9356790.1 tyrosine-type recombinase/integrase [Vibrio alginolyticus]
MNDAQLKAKLREGKVGKFKVDTGLYFRITEQGSAFWVLRYSINGKRRELTLGRYGRMPEGLPLSDAKLQALQLRASIRKGVDPIAEKKRNQLPQFRTVDDVAKDWLKECERHLENPQIPARVYRKDISPYIGELSVDKVSSRDILQIIRLINQSGRPSISNDALNYCKQLFNHALKLDLLRNNPAAPFTEKDAGGTEKSRDRVLSLQEIETIFQVFRENSNVMTRENYLAIAMLIIFGVRKGELIAAQWNEFDFENMIWELPTERIKTGAKIVIPIPVQTIPWFKELHVRANGSDYLFPSRRASKRRKYISDDTLNHALAKLFGKKVDSKKQPLPNILGEHNIEHFVVHDLRRTCRSLLAENGVPSHVAERCLNHKIKGVEGIYDRYDYLEERRNALNCIADKIVHTVNLDNDTHLELINSLL